jgi:hypothetical protein
MPYCLETLNAKGFKSSSEYQNYRYANEPEFRQKILERRRRYLESHKVQIKARLDTEEHREYMRRKWAEYYAKNPQKFWARNHVNYRKNKPEILAARKRKALESKTECVKYLGGKCEICGYGDHIAALQFHHNNPSEKEFDLTKRFCNGHGLDKLRHELNKCSLLCANCHSIISYLQQQDNRG